VAVEDYNNDFRNDLHHLRRDARDAHSNSNLAKWLSILSLIISGIALLTAMMAFNKAGEAQSTANQAMERANSQVQGR
jgi:hypothetical protein